MGETAQPPSSFEKTVKEATEAQLYHAGEENPRLSLSASSAANTTRLATRGRQIDHQRDRPPILHDRTVISLRETLRSTISGPSLFSVNESYRPLFRLTGGWGFFFFLLGNGSEFP